MSAATPIIEWPSIRDVSERLGVTCPFVYRLVSTKRLRVVQTRLGKLVDPESVREYEAGRQARKERVA